MPVYRWDPVANALVDVERGGEPVPGAPPPRAPLERINVAEVLRAIGVDDSRLGLQRLLSPETIDLGVSLGEPHQTLPSPRIPTRIARYVIPATGPTFPHMLRIRPVRSELHVWYLSVFGVIPSVVIEHQSQAAGRVFSNLADFSALGTWAHEEPDVLVHRSRFSFTTSFDDIPVYSSEMLAGGGFRRVPIQHELLVGPSAVEPAPLSAYSVSIIFSEVRGL